MKNFNQNILSSLDYLMASTDYQEFVYLMLDFKDMGNYVDEPDNNED